MFRRIGALLIIFICLVGGVSDVAAAEQKNKGLFITPVREYIQVPAGQSASRKITLANITEKPAEITLSIGQFTVANFTYDYKFAPNKRDWIKLEATQLKLEPGKSREVAYTITVPDGVAPGGYYFTVFATKELDAETGRKIRVGEALYVTVEGDLRRTSHIQNDAVPPVVFGGDVPFSFDAKSTGNTHFFMYVSGSLKGVATDNKSQEATHLLLPGTVRTAKGTIPAPSLPGIYQATYGYRVDDGQTITHTKYIAYLPLWFIAIFVGIIVLAFSFWQRYRRRKSTY